MTPRSFPAAPAREVWIEPFCRGSELHSNSGFRLAIDAGAAERSRVQIFERHAQVRALVSPAVAALAAFGSFEGDTLAAVGSAYPFGGDTRLADIGVVTLPAYRGQGRAKSVVHALARHALAEGYEPQYRCQLDNASSIALAGSAGFESIGTWDVPLPGEITPTDRKSA